MTDASEDNALGGARAREAALREILHVISHSRDDEQPVFETILRCASRLCEAPFAGLYLADESRSYASLAASLGARPEYLEIARQWPLDNPASVPRAIARGEVVHTEDLKDTDIYRGGDRQRVDAVDIEGIRTYLAMPLLQGGQAIGCIGLYRREVRPFTPEQITLVETFAAQAVIAIENVRQFRELQTRLEREAATREILSVISQSRDDEQPVFEAILENAARLCNAPIAFLSLASDDRSEVLIPAHRGTRSEFGSILDGFVEPISRTELVAIRPIVDGLVVREDDIKDHDTYRKGDPRRRQMVDVEGARSVLGVPLLQGGVAIGAIILYRREVQPFTDDDVLLIENFAAQAVIAIENVRQFRELQTRLEREKATREILDVVSRSRDDEYPVFNVILENACRLCEAQSAFVIVLDEAGEFVSSPAQFGAAPEFASVFKDWRAPYATSPLGAVVSMRERRVVTFDDLADTDLYRSGNTDRVRQVDIEGVRSLVNVPLLSSDEALGSIILYRREVRPFSVENIALVEAFAAQAVIAIENVRQFRALEALNAELGDRVEEQVGEIERMGRLKRFLSPAVADAVVSRGEDAALSSHRALIATLFCDIRGFTTFCETAEPEETIEFLQTYHEEMGKLISAHGGGVDKRMGDGIMVLFNDPLPCDDPAGQAVELAIAMRARMVDLCVDWKKLGHRLGFGVGISLGYATVGMVGSEGRYDYTASGTSVNLASRLCDRAEDGDILLSPRALIAVEDRFATEPAGEMDLKGLSAPVAVARVTG